jgi:hypothetical protein
MRYQRTLETVATPDVLVCGAGCAGTVAGIAAARRGATTLVVERFGFAGGYLTAVTGAAFDGYVDLRSGRPVVGGIVSELARSVGGVRGDPADHVFGPSNDLREMVETPDRSQIRFDLEGFKLEADRMLKAAGAKVLYHTQVVDVLRDGDAITGVVIANKGGLGVIRPKAIVDATGDADVAAYAGLPFAIDDDMQPMSLHFRIANVTVDGDTKANCARALERARAAGELGLYGGPWMGRLGPGELYVNATRFAGSGVDPEHVTAAEIQGREDARVMFDLFKAHVPGFEHSYFVSSGPSVGARETRRLHGMRTLTGGDVAESRPQDDVVALGSWYLDRHPKTSSGYHVHGVVRPYDIGYGTLVPTDVGNLWVAGRCHSVDQVALASSRVTVTAMALGQAAGTAAAQAIATGSDARELDVPTLQRRLLADGAIILDRAAPVLATGDAMIDRAPASVPR